MVDTDAFSSKEIVAKTLDGEAANQGYKGLQAVANTIANRVKLKGWMGKDFRSVCLHPYQYSCWLESPDRTRIMAATEANDPIYAQCLKIASLAIGGQLPDITGGATHYYAVGTTKPKWADGVEPIIQIGDHIFYKVA